MATAFSEAISNDKAPEKRPRVAQRQSSVTELLNKFTANSFSRSRVERALPHSTSTVTALVNYSRLPTPSGVPRSTSFFSNLNKFGGKTSGERRETGDFQARPLTQTRVPRSTSFFSNLHALTSRPSNTDSEAEVLPSRFPTSSATTSDSSISSDQNSSCHRTASNNSQSDNSQRPASKRSRRISSRLTRTSFFSRSTPRAPSGRLTPNKIRTSSVKVEQRGLMKPVPPPLPRSTTTGNIGQGSSTQCSPRGPSYMTPTSSSQARRSICIIQTSHATSPLPKAYLRRTPTPSRIPTPLGISSATLPRLNEQESVHFDHDKRNLQRQRKSANSRRHTDFGPGAGLMPSSSTISSGVGTASDRPLEERLARQRALTNVALKRSNAQRSPVKKSSAEQITEDGDAALDSGTEEAIIRSPRAGTYAQRTDSLPHNLQEMTEIAQATPRPADLAWNGAVQLDFIDTRINTESTTPTPANASFADNEHVSHKIDFVLNGRPLLRRKTCPCGARRAFQECCMLVLEEEACQLYGDLDRLYAEKGTLIMELKRPVEQGGCKSSTARPEEEGENFAITDLIPTSSEPRYVHTSQCPIYWLGRFIHLNDTFLSLALAPFKSSFHSISLAEYSKHPMIDDAPRTQRIYIHLRNMCMTDEARKSLDLFRTAMEEREKRMAGLDEGRGKEVREKKGFFEKLTGRGGR